MEQHVIKRTLYVGLGGTGMSALLNTKKMFVDTYGEVPPMIGFLGLDTDKGEYAKSLISKKSPGGRVRLEANETLPIIVEDALEIYNYEKENLGWFPEYNLRYLSSMTLGAGQVRSNGRFALTVNRLQVERRVHALLNRISSAIHDESRKYKPSTGDEIEIAIVFSICGGTGCGTFINTAYLLREIAPKCKISGYVVLPKVFQSMLHGAGVARIEPNAYGALQDLDFLMSMTGAPNSPSFEIKYFGRSQTVNTRPFDAVFFIDNKNAKGSVFDNLDKLSEMISLALVTSSGALATDAASISDNVSKEISEGNFDVDNKVAWASGMGACEIKISHDILEEIYSLKAAKYLIDLMRESSRNSDAQVRTWIDATRIRENEGNNQLIDRLMPNYLPEGVLDINPESPQSDVDGFIELNKVDTEELNRKLESILVEVKTSFNEFICNCISSRGGITSAINIINRIREQFDIYLNDIKEEHAQHEKEIAVTSAEYKTCIDDLLKYDRRLLKQRRRIQEYCEDVVNAVKAYISETKNYARKGCAITFFSNLKVYVDEWERKVLNLKSDFDNVYAKLDNDINIMENKSEEDEQNSSFTIDLTSKCIKNIVLNKEQVRVERFVGGLKNGIIGLSSLSEDEIKGLILSYTNKLGATQEFSEFSIDDVFNELSEKEFTDIIDSAIRKSTPLFRYDYHGRRAKNVTGPNDLYFIGVPNKDNNRLRANNSRDIPFFESRISGDPNIQFATIGLPDRVIVFRQVGVVPVYTIEDIKRYENRYRNEACKCYIDAVLNSKMEQMSFSIWPKRERDVLEVEQYEYWVKACIFNLIRNVKGQYQIRCSKGKRIDDGWYRLHTYRNLAFEEFQKIFKEIKDEIDDYVNNETVARGKQEIDRLLQSVKDNYWDDQYCHLYLERKTLDGIAYRPVLDMFEEELSIVEKLTL